MSATTLISILILTVFIASLASASPLNSELKNEEDSLNQQSVEETRIINWITDALSGVYNVTLFLKIK
jgi:hypothetical protein